MAISLDTQLTVTHNIVAYEIGKDGAVLAVNSKPVGRPGNTSKVILDLTQTVAVLNATPNNTRTRGDDLEYAFLVYLRDNGFL